MRYHEMNRWILEGDIYAFKGTDGNNYEAVVKNISFYRPPDEIYVVEIYKDGISVYPSYIAASPEIMGRIVEGQEVGMPEYSEDVFLQSRQPQADFEENKFGSFVAMTEYLVNNRIDRTAAVLGTSGEQIRNIIDSVWDSARSNSAELQHDGLLALDPKNIKIMDEEACCVVLNIPEKYITLKVNGVMELEEFDSIDDLAEYVKSNNENTYRTRAKEIYESYYTPEEDAEF